MKKLLLLFVFVLIAGCGPKEASIEVQTPASSEIKPAANQSIDASTAGILKGTVFFEGVAPEPKQMSVKGNPECAALHVGGTIASEELVTKDGLLQNVFVYVKQGLESYSFAVPSAPVTVENKACRYVPHVTGVRVGQSVVFLNQDATLHNIHAYPKAGKAFNLGLPLVGMKQTKKFDAPEVMVPLKCDVHPWMLGYVGALPHPYFQVTGAEGVFELKDLPPGEYVLEAWHEKLGTQTQAITLGSQETKEISFTFKS